ncbi:phosphoenolpyruvate--protein phosphotransferase [Thalassotalea euphylliae]|uniref:phosphoenolpyruvate--protein phosphotransferase n=1 Tax=Thalassotalea euphylliae TaxID=1655234 RepID=A0A3E0UE39_9GAMM|nr:phosphoenolpyruvate--protein phosphotransferase [Thalassotalea euphylliae]REL35166.1 phosphoenolpyruvate-protein phosphotransferase PtsP [Thalassotalea euphylliae]
MLTTLRRIVLEFGREPELEIALQQLVTQVKQAMNTDCCSIYLADYQHQHFLLMASDGLAKGSLGYTRIGFTEGLVGLVGQREEPLNIANAHAHPHFKQAPEVQEDDLRAFLGTPIIHQRKVIGILSIQQKQSRSFNENEEAFLVTLSAQLATVLADAEKHGKAAQTGLQPFQQLSGIAGSAGVAMAPMRVVQPRADLKKLSLQKVYASAEQIERYHKAVLKTRVDFEAMSLKLNHIVAQDTLDIFEMYKQMLDNASIGKEVEAKIKTGWCAESALKLVIDHYALQFEALEEAYLRERASDIRDLGNRVLFNLQQLSLENEKLPEQFILVADDVTASMIAEYQQRGLQGIVSVTGSNNSHAAILARAMGLPAIMGISSLSLSHLDHQQAILDGYSGDLFISPDATLIQEYRHLIEEETALTEKVKAVIGLPAVTPDGRGIELVLNAGLSAGFEHSQKVGALGIGLYRTEIPFMNRSCFPSEHEQTVWYQEVLKAFPSHNVTMRTLDVGGDKALPYFPIQEDNPFLGWRGIRITLDHPEIFLLQVRAMIRANIGCNNLEIMLPMISSVGEVDDAVRLINQAYHELCTEYEQKLTKPSVGIMLEVPGVLYQLKELAQRVDFFSVGSNDLTQYLLAVDRNNSRVANIYDFYHPAVLRALNFIAQESNKYLVPLSLCGELASEPSGALLLLAMGYDKLSMNSYNISRVKWVIRHVELQRAKVMLSHALTLSNAQQVHNYLSEQLESLGLGGFVRAGM